MGHLASSVLDSSLQDCEGELVKLLPHEDSPYDMRDLFGRICWSSVIEPGDRVAGFLVETLGSYTSFGVLVEHVSDPQHMVRTYVELIKQAVIKRHAESFRPDLPEQLTKELQEAIQRWKGSVSQHRVERVVINSINLSAKVLTPHISGWPTRISDLEHHAPLILWIKGNTKFFYPTVKSLAIVGARAMTPYGQAVTQMMTEGVSQSHINVISGGAYGIDAQAHRTAVGSGTKTAAILAGGIDRLYPSGNQTLFHEILKADGALIAEQPPGTSPSRWRFLLRNRLLAAATDATVVIEAGYRSGSLNTAGHASQLGRPLGAVPGPITSLSSMGTHRLIREYDAQCISTVAELLNLVGVDDT